MTLLAVLLYLLIGFQFMRFVSVVAEERYYVYVTFAWLLFWPVMIALDTVLWLANLALAIWDEIR